MTQDEPQAHTLRSDRSGVILEERYLIREYTEGKQEGILLRSSTPDHLFLIQKVLNHFDTVPHLDLGLFGHGKHRPD